MLPPILSVSNTTVQHRVPPRQEHDGNPRGGQGQNPQGNRGDQSTVAVSSAAAGRVNILNLSGPETMTMSLSQLSDAIAKALDMPAIAGESPAMHALRLANALLAMNEGARMALERQLSHLLKGLPLQLVALALKQPGGAEAARVAAYLEVNRKKGDAATDAVVASYLQNEASEDDSLVALALRSVRPEIELKGVSNIQPFENQLLQAAFLAAQRVGIALPYVNMAIDDAALDDEDEDEEQHASTGGDHQDGDNGDSEADESDQQPALTHEATSGDQTTSLPAGDDEAADEVAYAYYQRMSGAM